MKKYLKVTILTIALVIMALPLAGCGQKDNEETQRYAWPLATCSTTDTITHIFASNFAEQVEKLSNGKMKIQVYPQSTLGGDRELMESCKDGDIPFVVQSPAPQVTFMPELCIFDSPCLFSDIEQARTSYNGEEFQNTIKSIYNGAGYELLGLADQGFRVMTSNIAFQDMSFFKGQKIRTMENSYHIQFWKAVGANPTPMSFSEVYIGLQQGTIDAQENAYSLIKSAKLYEQQKYIVETNAVPDYITLIASSDFMDERTEEEKEIINEAAKIAQQTACDAADENREECKQLLKDDGMEVQEIDEENWAKMQECSQGVYENIKSVTGDRLFELYSLGASQNK
jgi:tripartite ATP-independent transporter DctP family solute receptor